jgi:2-polyprenyl-3-methyl-5-hydroxy-6-metoxy-1,4-benzoquinol methylase
MNQSCPICGSNKSDTYVDKLPAFKEATIVQCLNCSHIYTILTAEIDTVQLYTDEIYKVVENRNSIFDRILDWEYRKVLKQLLRQKDKKGNLLDFGTGKGKFGWLAANAGWNVKCVETSLDRAKYAKEIYSLEVNTDFYDNGQIFPIRFDVITLFHVLEHLPQPKHLLKELMDGNLNENGILLIEVPNIKSWQAALAKSKWIHLDVPRHINHFSPEVLKKLLSEIGFSPVKTTFFSFHLGVLGMLDSMLKLTGYNKNIIFELKNRRTIKLLIRIALILPFAFVFEAVAAVTGKGGVIRMYSKRR